MLENFTSAERKILKALKTPKKIQDFVDRLKINFDKGHDTCRSPRQVLKTGKAHCIEAAMLAAAALRLQGRTPWLVDLESAKHDDDHVIAVFKQFDCWGAISKSNHAVLRYREPVYRTIHELVLSYFHEYTDSKGKKTLRKFAGPINLARFDKLNWSTAAEDVWFVPEYLVKAKHQLILNRRQISNLRRADLIERKIGQITQYHR